MRRAHPGISAHRNQQGFTLIELMIVVAIVALLAVVIVPSYRSHVIKANRSSAQSFMSQVANKEEQIMLDMRNYVSVANNSAFGNAPAVPAGGLSLSVPTDVSKNYNLRVTTSTTVPPTYTITAVPINPPQNDAECQTLTLDSTGAKGCTGTACSAGPQVCWK